MVSPVWELKKEISRPSSVGPRSRMICGCPPNNTSRGSSRDASSVGGGAGGNKASGLKLAGAAVAGAAAARAQRADPDGGRRFVTTRRAGDSGSGFLLAIYRVRLTKSKAS